MLTRLTRWVSTSRQSIVKRPSLSLYSPSKPRTSFKASTRGLIEAVKGEFEHEYEVYKSDLSLQSYLDKTGFTMQEEDYSSQVTMHRQVEGFQVDVSFQALVLDDEESIEGLEPGSYLTFQVTVSKANSASCMGFQCSYQGAQLKVLGLIQPSQSSIEGIRREKFSRQHWDNTVSTHTEYKGPDLTKLDYNLQATLSKFLKSLGVDDDLGAFLEAYSLDKEQRLYMEWLKRTDEFLS